MGKLSVWMTPMCGHLFTPWRRGSSLGVNSVFHSACCCFLFILFLLLFLIACDCLHVTERTHARL